MLSWSPQITIRSSRDGLLVATPNLIVDQGLNLLADLLAGETVNPDGLSHVALGAGTTPPAAGDTQLEDERYRIALDVVRDGTGRVISTALIPDSDANDFLITEIGWFIGGTSGPNSGLMIARLDWERQKTNDESLGIERLDAITEVAS